MARVKVPIDEDIAVAASIVKSVEEKATVKVRPQANKKINSKVKKLQKRRGHRSAVNIAAGLLITLLIVGLSWNNIRLHRQLKNVTANPRLAVEWQNKQVLTEIGILTDLPADEVPVIATVSDASQAKAQSSFFDKAENGDIVVQYVKANKVILYRPSTKRVIEAGPFNLKHQP